MITTAVAFGQRIALLHRGELPVVAPRILLPGDGSSVHERARAAMVRPDRISGRKRRPGGRTILTPEPTGPRRIVLPGQPTHAEEVRSRCLDVDPAPVDLEAARRHGGFGDEADVWRYESIVDQGYWRGRIAHLADTDPGSELLALLEERPASMDEPLLDSDPEGCASARAQTRLDSMAARLRLINALQGEQYADAAELALEYPADHEFIGGEVAMALGITQSAAGSLLATAFSLTTRLPATLVALRAGRISEDIATVLVGATAVVQDEWMLAHIEDTVLPTVDGRSRESVRRQVCREVIRLDPDGADARHRKARTQRTITTWGDVDGMGWMKIHAPMEDIAAAWEALTGLAKAAKSPGDDRTLGQRRVDVFADIFYGILDHGGFGTQLLPTQHGRKPHIGVLIPSDLLFGAGRAATENERPTASDVAGSSEANLGSPAGQGEPSSGVCELVGYGPISPGQGLRIAAEGVWTRIVYDPLSGTLLDFGTTRYEPPDSLKRWVISRDQECGGFGCAQPGWRCHIDHARAFSKGGPTAERNLSPLCDRNHRSKDGGGWELTINPDRSKTWTSPLGRRRTKPPHRLVEPRRQNPFGPTTDDAAARPSSSAAADPPPF